MIEFEVLRREYPHLITMAAGDMLIPAAEVEKLTFSGPVLLKILNELVAQNTELLRRIHNQEYQIQQMHAALSSTKSQQEHLANRWVNERHKWSSF